jgi:hypothetical protein
MVSAQEQVKLFCVVCQKELTDERVLRKAVTCSPEHAAELKKIRLRRRASVQRICKLCYQPSNPEERRLFKKWRKETQGLRERGRPRKKKIDPGDDPRQMVMENEITIQ